MTVQLAQRGVIVLPKAVRDAYNLKAGDSFTLLDIGGVFILTQRNSNVDALAERITNTLVEKGETLESMLKALREEREHYDGQS